MQLCIFEDEAYSHFFPVAYLRPCYHLRCGLFTLSERILRAFPDCAPCYLCRSYLHPMMRERGLRVLTSFNTGAANGRVLFVNGCLLDSHDLRRIVSQNDGGDILFVTPDFRLAAALLNGEHAQEAKYYLLEQNSRELLDQLSHSVRTHEVPIQLATYVWDLIEINSQLIERDILLLDRTGWPQEALHPSAAVYGANAVTMAEGARVEAMSVLDARHGPVVLAENAVVEPFSYIQGPAMIGRGTRIVGGQIREGTSIGPVCRVGGEVEESIIQGYTNKYHAGFLGHSYLGEWVNLGALTTNSDLKNTYGTIRVDVAGLMIDTTRQKLGVVIADHVKLGIGTLVMAGTTIGVGSNIIGSNREVPKVVPSFVWGGESGFSEYRLDKCIEVIEAMMARRERNLSHAEANLIRHIFYLTARERQSVLG